MLLRLPLRLLHSALHTCRSLGPDTGHCDLQFVVIPASLSRGNVQGRTRSTDDTRTMNSSLASCRVFDVCVDSYLHRRFTLSRDARCICLRLCYATRMMFFKSDRQGGASYDQQSEMCQSPSEAGIPYMFWYMHSHGEVCCGN